MKNIRSYGPVLQKNPSVLEYKVAPLVDMPQPIQLLYSYLQDCSITYLPDFKAKTPTELIKKTEYLDWRDMRFAIQDSLTRPYGCVKDRPVGILNHLYKMKT